MDSADVLKNFLRGIQKDDSPSKINIGNLKKWEGQLKQVSNVSHPDNFMKCVIKFIDFVVNYATTQSPKSQHSLCKDSFGVLKEIITPELKNVFVKQVTKRIFDIIIEENADSWCMKRELLKVFNFCIGGSDKMVRNKTVEEFSDIYMFKMVDSISSYGDYDLQVQLIETVFRMYGQITINKRLKELIPESQELSQSFAEINDETFDEDIRTFLNSLNKTSGKLFSLVCESIKVGEVVCQPVTNINGLWVDFNLCEATITWYCSTHSFLKDQIHEEDEVIWNLVTLFVSDIETVSIHSSADNSSFIIYCKLSGSCLSSGDYQDILDNANNLSILVQSSQQAKTLISEVLPHLFGKKIQQSSQRDARRKVSTKTEYKALNIKFKRRAKSSSRCKSDISGMTSLFDPASARSNTTKSEESALSKNRSPDQTRHSISSRSSKNEVITIDSSIEQKNRGARLLSVIPEQDERVAEDARGNDAISVNSSETGKSSDFAEASRIQIFSGRCSGSNMRYSQASRDRVCSTPKKVSTYYERNMIDTVRECKVSQTDLFETAQESPQSQGLTKVGACDVILSAPEEFCSADCDSQKTVRIDSYNDYRSCQTVDESGLKTISEVDLNKVLESYESRITSSDSLLKKYYSSIFPEITEDYDSVKIKTATDNRLRALENCSGEERTPVNFKVSTKAIYNIENINPSSTRSTNIECGNRKAAKSQKAKHSQAGKMGVLHQVSDNENNISLDFEDKLILTSEVIEKVPLKKGVLDNVKIREKVSKAIDSSHRKVSTKINDDSNDKRYPDEPDLFNSLEVNICEGRINTQMENNSGISKNKKNAIENDDERESTGKIQTDKLSSAPEMTRNSSHNELKQSGSGKVLRKNEGILTCEEGDVQASSEDMQQDMSRTKSKRYVHREKNKVIEKDEKRKSNENIKTGKQTSAPKVSRLASDGESKSDEILHKKKESDAHISAKDGKLLQDMSRTKNDFHKEENKVTETDVKRKSTKNIQADKQIAPKLSRFASDNKLRRSKSAEILPKNKESNARASSKYSKLLPEEARTKTKGEIYKEKKKVVDKDEKSKSTETIQAGNQSAPLEMSKPAFHSELGILKLDEIFQEKKEVFTCTERSAEEFLEDGEMYQDASRTTTKRKMKRSRLALTKTEDTTENVDVDDASKLDEEKQNVSSSNTGQVTEASVVDLKHYETSNRDKEILRREHEPNDKPEIIVAMDTDSRKHNASYKTEKQHVEHLEEKKKNRRKGLGDIVSKTDHNRKTPDLFENQLVEKQNLQVLEKRMARDVETTAGEIKKDVSTVDIETENLSGSKSINDFVGKRASLQTRRRSNRKKDDLKSILEVKPTTKTSLNTDRNNQMVGRKDPNLNLKINKIEMDEKICEIHEQKLIVACDNKQQADVHKATEESVKEELPIATQKEPKKKRSSRCLGKSPKKKPAKSNSKIQKSTLESSEDDNIVLNEVRKSLLKKKNAGKKISPSQKVDGISESSVTVSKTKKMPVSKVSEENVNIIQKIDEKPHFDDNRYKSVASSKDQNDNIEIYAPLEDGVKKISTTMVVTDKAVASEDSYSDNELIPDSETPKVRIDPDKAFDNLLKTSSTTSQATVIKVRVALDRIASDSSGESLIKTLSQDAKKKLKSTKNEELLEGIQEIVESPASQVKTIDAETTAGDSDTVVGTAVTSQVTGTGRELKSMLKSPKDASDPSPTENKSVLEISKETNSKDTVEKDSPALLEKNKKNVKFDNAAPAKKPEYQDITPNQTKDLNQTLSTTLSGRRRRKLYNPDDLSYLNSVTDPVSSVSPNDITENSNKTEKVKELVFLNRSSNVSVSSKKTEEVTDKLALKENNTSIKKGIGNIFSKQLSVVDKEKIERDGTVAIPGIVPLNKRIEIPAFVTVPKGKAKEKKPRKSISKNEISYRDIKKAQYEDNNKKCIKTVNLNTSIVNSSGKSHLKSFFENMLESFRDEMGGESLIDKLNKNKVKETKPNKKSKRSTNRIPDTGDKKPGKKSKSGRISKIISEQPKKRRETFHSAREKPVSVTKQIRRTTGDVSSLSPSLKLPKRLSHPVHKEPHETAPVEMQLSEENNNSTSDFSLNRNTRKRPKPFEDNLAVQREEEENQTDGACTAKTKTKINILSDIRIRPGWEEAPPSQKKIKMFAGPHLDNETIRDNFSQEQDLENADNTQSTRASSYPILVSKHAPPWHGAALLDNKIITLKSTDYLKKYLVMFFYPIDFGTLPYVYDPMEIISFNKRIEDFRHINVEIVACSVDSFFTHDVWVKHLKQEGLLDKLEIPLLSDANHHISKAYKIYSDHLGHTFRGVFIIDPNGIIVQEIKVGLLSRIDVDIFFNWLRSIQSNV